MFRTLARVIRQQQLTSLRVSNGRIINSHNLHKSPKPFVPIRGTAYIATGEHYQIIMVNIKEDNPDSFVDKVNEKIKEGWLVHGPLFHIPLGVCQVIVKNRQIVSHS